MEYALEQGNLSVKENKSLPIYLVFLLIPHILLYTLISNLHELSIPFAGLILVSFIMVLLFVNYFKTPIYLFYHLVFLIASQNILAGLGMNLFEYQVNGENIKMLMVYKEVFAILLIAALYIRYAKNFNLIKFEKLLPFFIIYLLYSFVTSSADMESKFYYMRGFAILFVSYFLGRLLFFAIKKHQHRVNTLLSFVVVLGIISVIFGFLFFIIDRSSHIWKEWFNLGYVMQAKGTAYTDHPDWSTPIGQYYIPRMFSFFFDTINLSYFIMSAIICSLFLKSKLMFMVRFLLFIGLLWTLGKGALGILVLVYVWIIALYRIKFHPRFFITTFISAIVFVFFFLKNSGIKSSIIVHFNGFIEPLLNSPTHPLGNGIGNGGVYYAMKYNISPLSILHMGAESFFGTMIYQLGYPGTIIYVLFLVGCIRYLLKLAYSELPKIDFTYIALSGIVFALFTISLFQEATFGLNYTGILLILVGFYISKVQDSLKIKNNTV
ncbi:hypothetical protein [Metabacillus sp. Hm71]|uniref:hypothetical protein n=1 Tax=Metabacillus sp. Hm71 TaxID=3450743 RepID=UPI003F42434D